MASIFLSYTSTDRAFTEDLAKRLTDHGVKVWIDEAELGIGDSLIERIGSAIEKADFLGVVISDATNRSNWVRHELRMAVNREIESGRLFVLPILVEKCQIPFFLIGKKYADFTTAAAAEKSFRVLLRTLQRPPDATTITDSELPGFRLGHVGGKHTPLILILVALLVLSVGLAIWLKAPAMSVWQSPPDIAAVGSPPNTRITRDIRSLSSTPLRDTLTWQFAVAPGDECDQVEVLMPVTEVPVRWDPMPETERDVRDPTTRNINFYGFPARGAARVGVVVKGTPPSSCLHFTLHRDARGAVLDGPLAIARLRTKPAALAGSMLACLVLLWSLPAALSTAVRSLRTRKGDS